MNDTCLKVSPAVKFFEEGFKSRHGLVDYQSGMEAVFLGCYGQEDIDLILSHKPFKTVVFLGLDVPNIDRIKCDNVLFASDKNLIIDIYRKKGLPHLPEPLELKDFSNFTPAPLGDKVYVYLNTDNEAHWKKHNLKLLEPAIEHFGRDRFIFGTKGKSEAEVIEDYKKCRINIHLNSYAGHTTALEMYKMGRMSISNAPELYAIPFKDSKNIIDILSKKLSL